MTSLSPELWHTVASHLSIEDATQLRLVNKFFADVAGAHILPDVTFHMHQDDFARLRGIASNGVLAPNVRSITYFAREYESPVISVDKFKKIHKDTLMFQAPPFSLNPESQVKPADDLTLWHEYKKYERMVAVQDQIKAGMADLACLKDALAKFTALRQATMSSGHVFYEGWANDKPSPFKAPVQPPTKWLDPEGVRHLEVTLEALTYNNVQLESLRAGTFDWTFFDKTSTELERLFRPALNAFHVELEISLRLDDNMYDVDGQTEKCRQFMERGMVRDVLARMRRLELLRVAFMCNMDEPYKPAVLRNIMSPSHHWPNLTQLELTGVQGDRHAMLQVLRLHKDTLRFLCLQDFDLGETSWEKLLPDIRNTLHLEDACICGDLTGHVEDGPDKGQTEFWDFNRPGIWENDMRASVNRYCRRRGEDYPDELPLTDEVVQKHFDQYVRRHVKQTQAEDWEDMRQAKKEMDREVREMRRAGLLPPPRDGYSEGSESDWGDSGLDDPDRFDDDDDEYDAMAIAEFLRQSEESDGSVD